MGIDVIAYAPFLIMIMSYLILVNLWRLYTIYQDWEQLSLMLSFIGFIVLYAWILIYNPTIESARFGLRVVLSASLAIYWRFSYSYIKKFKVKRG